MSGTDVGTTPPTITNVVLGFLRDDSGASPGTPKGHEVTISGHGYDALPSPDVQVHLDVGEGWWLGGTVPRSEVKDLGDGYYSFVAHLRFYEAPDDDQDVPGGGRGGSGDLTVTVGSSPPTTPPQPTSPTSQVASSTTWISPGLSLRPTTLTR